MTFGFQLRNGAGRYINYGQEINYHFWAKVTITGSHANVRLRTIPASWKAKVFVHCNKDINFNVCTVYQNSGDIRATTSSSNGATFSLYIFVPANRVPRGGWGMVLWNTAGVQAFNSSRPLLKIYGLTTITTPSQSTGTSRAVAAFCQQQTINAVPNPGINSTEFWLYTTMGFNRKVTSGAARIGAVPGIVGQDPIHNAVRAPFIDKAHFDKFSSLGNP
ncbi:hypothetical protein GL177_19160 [Vibrio toranzoniae]|uniref:hypothetical protein n=1 Tax=Vibrio toranzoniae TaxID=1194427 RepID=UPI0013789FFB|nr:hypothetical protein [Vibrio toranzoniae]NAZ55433.1 hypothetical protein [Vibrio toranzoniae]